MWIQRRTPDSLPRNSYNDKHTLWSRLRLVSNAWRTNLKAWAVCSNSIAWSFVKDCMSWSAISLFGEEFSELYWTMLGYLSWRAALHYQFYFMQDVLHHVYPVSLLLSSELCIRSTHWLFRELLRFCYLLCGLCLLFIRYIEMRFFKSLKNISFPRHT